MTKKRNKEFMLIEYDLVIYPIKVWIGISKDLIPLVEMFLDYDSMKSFRIDDVERDVDAFTATVVDKHSSKIGILIFFHGIEYCCTGTVVHEVTHAVQRIWKRIGERKPGNESTAYLMEYLVGLVEEVKVKYNGSKEN